jgi:succinate dehydrogenase / fumarate reductase cytochrome b subunit
MIGALTLYQTTIGKKVVMAVTGLILFGYVFIHMLGNLKIYQGPDSINTYGVFLREVGAPLLYKQQLLWTARIVLLVSTILHIWAAYQLTRRDLVARPVGYAMRKNTAHGYAARTMRWGGVLIALFIVYHILHFTTGTAHHAFHHEDIYHNVVAGFRVWPVSLFYILAMIALGLHIYHGVWSMMQTLGAKNRSNDGFWRGFALVFALAIALGNISVPVAVLLGIVR